MCTVFYFKSLGLLSKNRDKSGPTDEELVIQKNYLAVKTRGADYYSIGMNAWGCAFASTAINPPQWTSFIEAGHKSEADKFIANEQIGKFRATVILSRMLSEVKNIQSWLDALAVEKIEWMGYNLVLVDAAGGSLVEVYENKTHIVPLEPWGVVTNHFHHLKGGPLERHEYPNSWDRLEYARESVSTVHSRDDLDKVICPRELVQRSRIWRDGTFSTVSSVIADLNQGELCYRKSPNGHPVVYKIKMKS